MRSDTGGGTREVYESRYERCGTESISLKSPTYSNESEVITEWLKDPLVSSAKMPRMPLRWFGLMEEMKDGEFTKKGPVVIGRPLIRWMNKVDGGRGELE